ncbi:MAG TPA: hypothetical protein VG944_04700 [Fimbriimonas sp.]|nr:hypothetical protein [Fimbriimonas sp.]
MLTLSMNPHFTYEIDVHPGPLKRASGLVPLPGGRSMRLSWKSQGAGVELSVVPTRPVKLRIGGKQIEVEKQFESNIRAR